MSFIKQHWFGMTVSLLALVFLVLLILILLAPKQDAKQRGFVKCTQNMIEELLECDKKFACSISAIAGNTWCDIKVVGLGIKEWANGKQPAPWSNYIFEPEPVENPLIDEEYRAEYLKAYPDVKQEMMRLEKLRKDLENEQNDQNFNEEMLPEG